MVSGILPTLTSTCRLGLLVIFPICCLGVIDWVGVAWPLFPELCCFVSCTCFSATLILSITSLCALSCHPVVAREGTWTCCGHTIDKHYVLDSLSLYCLLFIAARFSHGGNRGKVALWAPALVRAPLAGLVFVVKPRETPAGAVQDISLTVDVNKMVEFQSVSAGAIDLVLLVKELENGHVASAP